MNTNNLMPGMVLTYPELCSKLEIEPLKDNSKKAQLKEIATMVEFRKNGRFFYIDQIYPEPIDTQRKLREDAKYAKFIEQVLLYYLINQDGYSAIRSATEWWVILGLVAQKYREYRYDYPSNIPKEVLDQFYHITSTRFSGIFNRALKTLRDRRFIEFQPTYLIIEADGNRREAFDDEISIIIDNERQVLNSFNIHNRKTLILQPYEKQKKIYQAFNHIHHDEYGWKRAYPAVKIIYVNKESLKIGLNYANQDMYYLHKKDVNRVSKQAIRLTIDNKYHKDVSETEIDEYLKQLDDQYCLQMRLIDELIDIDYLS